MTYKEKLILRESEKSGLGMAYKEKDNCKKGTKWNKKQSGSF